MDDLLWNIRKIFKYKESYQEHCGDGVIYYDCELLIDFGPFKKGHTCNISINSQTNGDFSMYVDCDGMGHGGTTFVPVWTCLPQAD
jgi:hypothetical protein